MNRLERLSSILTHLQSKKTVTAGELAARYGICLRTVYRDIRSLEASGVPIGSEAGKGYYLAEGYRLPPVRFTSGWREGLSPRYGEEQRAIHRQAQASC